MAKHTMHAVALTPRIRTGDIAHNIRACAEAARSYANYDLVVFGELVLTGATAQDLFLDHYFCTRAEQALEELAMRTKDIAATLVVGTVIRNGDKLHNGAALIRAGRIERVVYKQNLRPEERRWFAPGNHVSQTEEIGVTFADDPHIATPLAIVLDASPYLLQTQQRLSDLVSTYHEQEMIYVNAGPGESTENATFEGTKLFAQNGVIITQSLPFHTFALTQDQAVPPSLPLTYSDDAHPFIPDDMKRATAIIQDIQAHGLAERIKHTKSSSITLGLSGGLDSACALMAALKACELLDWPASAIHTVSLPSTATTSKTHKNASELAKATGTTHVEIAISEAVEQHLKDIHHPAHTFDVTYENAQARERTQILFDLANQEQGIVLGTGDMSELALGFATYNGDLSCHYGVNANLPKTLMQAVMTQLGLSARTPHLARLLQAIVDTPISPELIQNQRTEDILGPYEVHDFYLYHILHMHMAPQELLALAQDVFSHTYTKGALATYLKTFYKRFFASQFKRNVCADSPQVLDVTIVGPRAFRLPADVSATMWTHAL